nr:hypothetical protein BaRGS_004330 [Batillaria attramentaria]
MMVLSQLQFRKYLDNHVDPITAAATRLLPRPATLGNADGDFDVLIISRRSQWWERSVTDHGQDTNMTDDLYERLVARFCGPATSIEVPTVTTPRRCMELRTPSEAIAHTGLTMAILTLYPEQLDLLNRPGLEKLFLWGPPGDWPEDCEGCADIIADILMELRVGQSGQDLQYRDTIILCDVPRDDLTVVSRLRARGLPVQVVTRHDDEAAIRDMALSTHSGHSPAPHHY